MNLGLIVAFAAGLAAQKYLGLGDKVVAFVKNLISPPAKADPFAAQRAAREQRLEALMQTQSELLAKLANK